MILNQKLRNQTVSSKFVTNLSLCKETASYLFHGLCTMTTESLAVFHGYPPIKLQLSFFLLFLNYRP